MQISYPLPGTLFYDKVKADLTERTNWSDSNSMSMLFKNTYQPEFYKQLYNYVHASYRKHRAIRDLRNWDKPFSASLEKLVKQLRLLYYEIRFFVEKRRLKRLERFAV